MMFSFKQFLEATDPRLARATDFELRFGRPTSTASPEWRGMQQLPSDVGNKGFLPPNPPRWNYTRSVEAYTITVE